MFQIDLKQSYKNLKRHPLISNNRGSMFLYVMTIISALAILGSAFTGIVIYEMRSADWQVHRTEAFYLSDAGVQHGFYDMEGQDFSDLLKGADGQPNTSDDGILSFGGSVALGNGNYSVIVTDNDDGDSDLFTDSDGIVYLTSTATLINETYKTVAMIKETTTGGGAGSADFRAVITAAGPIETKGNIQVDGREHDLTSAVIPNSGVLGISTVSTYSQKGSSDVGGTDSGGTDYAPSKPGNSAIIETLADWSAEGGFPLTPDEVLGLSNGTLKQIAQSGDNGSQYVTSPSQLTFPLLGVTYVELASGSTWQSINFSNSSGILVVHNTSTNAIIKNLNGGSFTGILIADDMVHIHTDILGAIVVLTPAPSSGNCIGNGSGDVRYSSQAISDAMQNTGSTISTLEIKSWYRDRN